MKSNRSAGHLWEGCPQGACGMSGGLGVNLSGPSLSSSILTKSQKVSANVLSSEISPIGVVGVMYFTHRLYMAWCTGVLSDAEKAGMGCWRKSSLVSSFTEDPAEVRE